MRVILQVSCIALAIVSAATAGEPGLDLFERRVRPLLATHCYECHSAAAVTSKKIKGGLQLDSRAGMRAGGDNGPAVVPGKPDEGTLLAALRHETVEMPPDEKLPDETIADIARWIELGAPDPREGAPLAVVDGGIDYDEARKHWAYQPPRAVAPPRVRDAAWPRGDIDRYILARIEAAKLTPAADAAPHALLRRLSFDLTGLPPTPEETDAFITAHEQSPTAALERAVDRLLASPQFGVQWARHWLDGVRYNESIERVAYFRNWVIDAYNADLPYDKFIEQQLAGDLVARDRGVTDPGELSQIFFATQLLCMNLREMDAVEGMVEVVGQQLLGLSINCAKCHDHKFDAFSQEDYYALAGIFTSSEISSAADLRRPAIELPGQKATRLTALVEGKVADTWLLNKGDRNQRKSLVPRRFPRIIAGDEQTPIGEFTPDSGRLQLARWIASPENPLTARVIVNRLWQRLIGRGLVPTVNDFGTQGEPPTHPKLLDYLALRLVASGWSQKTIIREIVLSRTYQQSRTASPTTVQADLQNALFTRMPPKRLQAEQIIDNLLAVSGRLNLDPPPVPAKRNAKVPGTRFEPSVEPCHRAIYHVDKNLLAMFDGANPELIVEEREASVTASQMLFFLNHREAPALASFVARCAEQLAGSEGADARVAAAYRLLFARAPSAAELAAAQQFLRKYKFERYCHVLLATNEFVYLD